MDLKDYELELFPDTKEVVISGSISSFFYGLTIYESVKEDIPNMLVGLPITNSNGKIVGKITEVDVDNDIWSGVMFMKGGINMNIAECLGGIGRITQLKARLTELQSSAKLSSDEVETVKDTIDILDEHAQYLESKVNEGSV